MTPIYLNAPTRRETKDSLIIRSLSENYVQEMKIATSQTLQHLCSCKGRMKKPESGNGNGNGTRTGT